MGIEIHYEFTFIGTRAELDAALAATREEIQQLHVSLILNMSEHEGMGEIGYHVVLEHDPEEFPPADASPLGKSIYILSDATTLSLGFKPITPRTWIAIDSIKTSAAACPVQVHNKACDVLDMIAKRFTSDIDDETGFYKSRDIDDLTRKQAEFEDMLREAVALAPRAIDQMIEQHGLATFPQALDQVVKPKEGITKPRNMDAQKWTAPDSPAKKHSRPDHEDISEQDPTDPDLY